MNDEISSTNRRENNSQNVELASAWNLIQQMSNVEFTLKLEWERLKFTPDKINELHTPGHQRLLQEVLILSASYQLPNFLNLACNS
jgi:hypothetical protein